MPNIVTVPAVGAFDPTDITLTDNTSGAFLVKEGSNEYMRIDTTDTQEKTIFTTQSGANTGFFVSAPAVGNVLSIIRGGSPATVALLNTGTTSFQVDSDKILNDLVSDSKTFKVEGTNVVPLTITGDSNAAYLVNYDAAAENKFKVGTNRTVNSNDLLVVSSRVAGLGEIEGVFFSGPSTSQVWVNGPSVFRVQGAAFAHNTQSGRNFAVNGSGGGLLIENSSNATFTLDAATNSTFEVKDDTATPDHYLHIKASDLDSSQEDGEVIIGRGITGAGDRKIELSANAGLFRVQNAYHQYTSSSILARSNTNNQTFEIDSQQGGNFIFQGKKTGAAGSGGSNESNMTDLFRLEGANNSATFRLRATDTASTPTVTAGKFSVKDMASADIFVVDEDSNGTFTLDDASGATFKVTDSGGSPTNFFSATEGGNTFIDSDSTTFVDSGGATHLRASGTSHIVLTGGELQLGASGKFVVLHNGYPLYKRSPNLLDLGATTGTTVLSLQSNGAYKKVKCTPTTSGQTFTIEFQDGTSANRDFVAEQDFAIHNAGTENCTIQATITSGRGSGLGKDLSAGGSTSGELVTGMTLNAGKSALFKVLKWNKDFVSAGASETTNQFMFQTIMVEA